MTVGNLVQWLEEQAPLRYQESYDNSGLLVGNSSAKITGVLCCLDTDEQVLQEALDRGCNMVLSHHPIIFKGLKRLTGLTAVERAVAFAIRHDIAIYAGHTNWDSIAGGVSFSLARKIGLSNVKVMMPRSGELLQLVVYVPTEYSDQVSEAAFSAGAGKVGNYDQCHFATEGKGTFRPLLGSKPFMGLVGQQVSVMEQRLEFVLPSARKLAVQKAVWEAHPYEEVAHSWLEMSNTWAEVGYGAVGELDKPMFLSDFLNHLSQELAADSVRYSRANLDREVKKVAVCGGAGAEFIGAAAASGADVYVTGDAKYHGFQDTPRGIVLVDVGHGESEHPFVKDWADAIRSEFVTFAVLISETDNRPVRTYQNHG